jgi:hypothetical protein
LRLAECASGGNESGNRSTAADSFAARVNGPSWGGVKPNFADVLAAVQRGRVVRLSLDADQKAAFRDPDGQLALSVLRHALAARVTSVSPNAPPEPFPLVPHFIQAVARKLDLPIGEKRARVLRRRLIDAHIIEPSAAYRQPYPNTAGDGAHFIQLYRLAVSVAGYVRRRACCAPRKVQASVGRGVAVKPVTKRRYWQHGWFGDADGEPPPQLSRRQRRTWKSADERMATWR